MKNRAVSQLAERLQSRVPVDSSSLPGVKLAAVAAVLRVSDSEPELLFIKRAERDGDPWSGHMAFPGGRLEPADASLLQTAIRETHEELSLDLNRGTFLGRLDDLAPLSPSLPPVVVRPFVALVSPDVLFTPNDEVAATYWIRVSQLLSNESHAEHIVIRNGSRLRFPGYRVEEHIVWGMTERIVHQLLSFFEP